MVFIVRDFRELRAWATGFLLISDDMFNLWLTDNVEQKQEGYLGIGKPKIIYYLPMTLEKAKMKFSDAHQKVFEASWDLRELKKFPVEDVCIPDMGVTFSDSHNSKNVCFFEDGTPKPSPGNYRIGHPNLAHDGTKFYQEYYGDSYDGGSGYGNPFFCFKDGHASSHCSHGYGTPVYHCSESDYWGCYGLEYEDGTGSGTGQIGFTKISWNLTFE